MPIIGETMGLNTARKGYPYSKSRVYLSAAIVILSVFLALTMLETVSQLLYYLFSTLIATVATFLLKMRLYPLITSQKLETEQDQTETNHAPWKALLLAFSMLLLFLLVPLLFAGLLTGPVWFILIVSFTSGVSISEIVFYFQTRTKERKPEKTDNVVSP